jgi:hypothetical protein
MGWLYGWNTRAELADHLINHNGVKTIKHCFKGNNLWAVQEGQKHDGTTVQFIALYLIRGSNNSSDGWGYKDMGESAGPYYFSCPLAYLDMVPDPGGYATEWREKVREHHAKASRKFVEGTKIKLYGREYTMGAKHPSKQGYDIWDYTIRYFMPKRMFKHVEVLA